MVKQYDDKIDWESYVILVESSKESMRTWDEDSNKENYYPAIVMKVANPTGPDFNEDLVSLYPSEGDMDTNVDNYRKAEKNNVGAIAKNGLQFSIVYSLKQEAKTEAGINLARTCWVIGVLAIAAIHFSNATNKLVLHPLERMLEIVKKIAKDPASAAASDEMKLAGIHTYMHQNEKKEEE